MTDLDPHTEALIENLYRADPTQTVGMPYHPQAFVGELQPCSGGGRHEWRWEINRCWKCGKRFRRGIERSDLAMDPGT